MAYTLNNTLSDEFANSYCDLAFAEDYWDNHYLSTKTAAWSALSDDQKISLLIAACRTLETVRFTYPGPRTSGYTERWDRRTHTVRVFDLDRNPYKWFYYQALQFPRQLDINTVTGNTYIPEAILMAQCEQAVYTLTLDDTVMANRLQGVTRESVTLGTLKTSQSYSGLGSSLSPSALAFVRPFIIKLSTRIGRG